MTRSMCPMLSIAELPRTLPAADRQSLLLDMDYALSHAVFLLDRQVELRERVAMVGSSDRALRP